MAQTNLDKLNESIGSQHKPFIAYDIETTGCMNGNDNRITQISLAAYQYNADKGQYELYDRIFMLAKGDEENLRGIQAAEAVTDENIKQKLKDEYLYGFVDAAKKECSKAQAALTRMENTNAKTPGKYSQADIDTKTKELEKLRAGLAEIKETVEKHPEKFIGGEGMEPYTDAYNAYVQEHYAVKKEEMETAIKVEEVLKLQGLDFETYATRGEGLTREELQTGITQFIMTYKTADTVFVNNGTYFANHYLEKEGLMLTGQEDSVVIDLTQAERSMKGDSGSNRWTADFSTFAANYKADTGKEIKTFDAFTKVLCIGEMVSKAVDIPLEINSQKYLENAVKESAMSRDEDYVLSLARASEMMWIPSEEPEYHENGYYFDSLEYVDFGNDRRYVDIDKMFEMNDNFEITLEGEKEPIKTWEELETKIKALNSEISPELMEQIHEKYEELSKMAEQEREASHPESPIPLDEDPISQDFEYDDYIQPTEEISMQRDLEEAMKEFTVLAKERDEIEAHIEALKADIKETKNNLKEHYAAVDKEFGEKIKELQDFVAAFGICASFEFVLPKDEEILAGIPFDSEISPVPLVNVSVNAFKVCTLDCDGYYHDFSDGHMVGTKEEMEQMVRDRCAFESQVIEHWSEFKTGALMKMNERLVEEIRNSTEVMHKHKEELDTLKEEFEKS